MKGLIVKSILVVEDDHEIRVSIRQALEGEGYFVFSAANGIDGIAMLNRIKPPSLILLDQQMPLMGGEEFLKIKSRDANFATIPVIVVSAAQNKCHSSDVVSFIVKPLDIDKLLSAVKQHCLD